MISTKAEATKYICESIKNIKNEEVMPEVIETIIEEKLDEIIWPKLTDTDLRMLAEHEDDEEFEESYMMTKVQGYQTALEGIVTEILNDYLGLDGKQVEMPENEE